MSECAWTEARVLGAKSHKHGENSPLEGQFLKEKFNSHSLLNIWVAHNTNNHIMHTRKDVRMKQRCPPSAWPCLKASWPLSGSRQNVSPTNGCHFTFVASRTQIVTFQFKVQVLRNELHLEHLNVTKCFSAEVNRPNEAHLPSPLEPPCWDFHTCCSRSDAIRTWINAMRVCSCVGLLTLGATEDGP